MYIGRKIHKQELPLREGNLVSLFLPKNSTPLSVGFQGDKLVLWYLFPDTDIFGNEIKETTQTRFHIVRTGEEIPVELYTEKFIGTATDNDKDMPFVVHVFLFL